MNWPNSIADSQIHTESSDSLKLSGGQARHAGYSHYEQHPLPTHDGGLPAPAVHNPPVVAQAREATEGEGASGGRDVQVVLVQQERYSHASLTLLPCVMVGDGALSLSVVAPILKLKSSRKTRAVNTSEKT